MADPHASHAAPVPAHDPHAHAPGHDDAHHVAKHVRGYLFIGGALMVLTVVTVALSYINFGSDIANIIVAMIVATFKAGLVAAIFMHLKGEKMTIWRTLIFTFIFAAGLFFLTYLHWWDPITGTTHNHH